MPTDEITGGASAVEALAVFTASSAASPVGAGGRSAGRRSRTQPPRRQLFDSISAAAPSVRRVPGSSRAPYWREQRHARGIVARQAIADHARDDRPAGRTHAGLDHLGRLPRVHHARGVLGAHHGVAQVGGIGSRLRLEVSIALAATRRL